MPEPAGLGTLLANVTVETNPVIKLTKQRSDSKVLIRIDGNLCEAVISELRNLVGKESGTLVLDLSGLTAIDPAGREFLLHLRESGHELRGGSLYIKRLLEESQS
jgi:anti-anti-sigma regulatory factor